MSDNVKARINDKGMLVLVINPKVMGTPAKTGRSNVLATARWLNIGTLEGGEEYGGLALNLMLIKKLGKATNQAEEKPAKRVRKTAVEEAPAKKKKGLVHKVTVEEPEEDFVETKRKVRGKKPRLNKDASGKVKAIASSNRPADKLKTRRAK